MGRRTGGVRIPSLASTRIAGTRTQWGHSDDFCRPSTCPICDGSVYFVRHNGGSVWFDSLGYPWPKHACFDTPPTVRIRLYYKSRVEPKAEELLGVVTETEVIEPGKSGRIVVKCHDQSIIDRTFTTDWDLVTLVGRLVVVKRDGKSKLSLSLVYRNAATGQPAA